MSSSSFRLSNVLWLVTAMAVGAGTGIYLARNHPIDMQTVMPQARVAPGSPYMPQSEAGAFLIAKRAEGASDWPATHRALQYLESMSELPPAQNARLFLSAIAAADWDTARKVAKEHPDAITKTSPLVQMIAAIFAYSENDTLEAERILNMTGYHPITAPVLPFVKGWILNETPRLGLMEAAQDIGFSTINMVRFYEASGQVEKSDTLMSKLQEADLGLPLLTWSRAYFERRGMKAEATAVQKKIDARMAEAPTSLLAKEQERVLQEAGGHVKNHRRALAITLIDATSFLEQYNASALALLYAQLAEKLAPDMEEASHTLASIYDSQENWDEALVLYKAIPKDDPSYGMAQMHIADILARADRLDEARSAYKKLTSEFRDNAEAWYQAGEFYRVYAEDFNAAINAYSRAAKLFGDKIPDPYWTLFLARGLSYEMTDRPELAEKDYETALKLQPDHPEALNTLAYAWADKGKNLDKAEAMLQRALLADPSAAHIIDSLGWVIFKRGRADDALPLLERASQMLPYDATVNEHLGDVYAAAGRKREAEFMWKRALDAADNDKQKAGLEAKLKK